MKLAVQGIGTIAAEDVFCEEDLARSDGKNCCRIHDTADLFNFIPKRKLRRIDHFSRIALLAAGRALQNTDPELIQKKKTGVILATGYGSLKTTFNFLDSYIEKGDKLASPTHFSNSVHNAPASHIAINYGITGPNLTISQFDISLISGLITAGTWLKERTADAVLIGSSDACCNVMEFSIKQLSQKADCSGSMFKESAAFLLLTRDDIAPRHGYLHDFAIGNIRNGTGPLPTDARFILCPPSVTPCDQTLIKEMEKTEKPFTVARPFSATDCSINIVNAIQSREKTVYFKSGMSGLFARTTISP